MKPQTGRRKSLRFPALVACAGLFVWLSGLSMPLFVASHFGISGAADAFMPRVSYMRFMLGIVVLLPLALVYLPNLALRLPGARINLPHRDYWLAAERRAETIEYLQRHSVRFGCTLLAFLCYVHWLVVRANAATPPGLAAAWFVGGLVAFLAVMLVWTIALFMRFRLPQR